MYIILLLRKILKLSKNHETMSKVQNLDFNRM